MSIALKYLLLPHFIAKIVPVWKVNHMDILERGGKDRNWSQILDKILIFIFFLFCDTEPHFTYLVSGDITRLFYK